STPRAPGTNGDANGRARRLPGDDDARGVRAAPDRVRETDACVVDLARSRLASKLVHDLDDLAERRRAERLAFRQQSAARIHGRARLGEQLRLIAGCTQVELLVREQLAGGIGVL